MKVIKIKDKSCCIEKVLALRRSKKRGDFFVDLNKIVDSITNKLRVTANGMFVEPHLDNILAILFSDTRNPNIRYSTFIDVLALLTY